MIAEPNIVGVVGDSDVDDAFDILCALARSCGLTIRRANGNEVNSFAGFIVLNAGAKGAAPVIPLGHSTIHVFISDSASSSANLRFDAGPKTPLPFRGRSVQTGSAIPSIASEMSGEVIATADGKPVWTTAFRAGARHDACWVSRPWLKDGECVFHHLNGSRFMNLLPVFEWLRSLSDWGEWTQPPLRACFMFDDPNLHGTTYGFVDFARLAAEGRRHNFHAAFATVPLDGYYVNRAAAEIFRRNPDILSFLVHGNNHTYRELASRHPPEAQLAMMQQAVVRIIRVERKAGISVSRVVAPPHGVCSAEMVTAMAEAGLEAVCVSHGSVWTGNPGAEWAVFLGSLPAQVVGGLPVLPRFRLSQNPENDILLAAYLHQPIIPVGHHWDLADGMDILASAAQRINGLGKVAWGDLTAIARNLYRFKRQGHVLRIQPFSRIMTVNVPAGVSEFVLEAPWFESESDRIECRIMNASIQQSSHVLPSGGGRFDVIPGSTVELRIMRTPNGRPPFPLPGTPLSVIVRKVLMELRDRSMPYLPGGFVRR